MSYTVSYFLNSNTIYPNSSNDEKQLKKKGYVLVSKLKKGMQIEIGIDRQEGDDCDGVTKELVTITKVTKLRDGDVRIEFNGSEYCSEEPELGGNHFYKIHTKNLK